MIINTAMPHLKHKVSVILINYNSSVYTKSCIESILRHTPPELSYNIIVIDNNSEPDDFASLREGIHDPRIELVRSKINLGFAAGNMYGTQFTTAEYYFFLNNDCELQNDCLGILANFCDQDKTAGLCAPQMYDATGQAQRTFDYFPALITKFLGTGLLRFFNPGKYPDRRASYDKPLKVDLVSGSAMFVRSSAFDLIGGFDTTFFLYCEEEDIALRIKYAGYSTYLVPMAKNVHHAGSSTVASLGIRKEFYISFLYFYNKHYGFAKTQILKLMLVIKLARKAFSKPDNLTLAFFVLRNAPFKDSLRHKQKMREL